MMAAEARLQALGPRLTEMDVWHWKEDSRVYLARLAHEPRGKTNKAKSELLVTWLQERRL